jgi:hypothetical protein
MTKTIVFVVAVILLYVTARPPQANAEACPRWRTATGPTGTALTLCTDGRYSTCVRDSRRPGWHEAHAQSYCGKLRDEGKVKWFNWVHWRQMTE